MFAVAESPLLLPELLVLALPFPGEMTIHRVHFTSFRPSSTGALNLSAALQRVPSMFCARGHIHLQEKL